MATEPNDYWKTVPILWHFAVGGGLFYGIQKLFKEVEEKLTDDTKLQIAIWLVGVNTTRTVENWPVTFTKMFDRVFGRQHVTWKCFWRSSIASYSALFVSGIVGAFFTKYNLFKQLAIAPEFLVTALLGNVFTDYISLLQTRKFLEIGRASCRERV